jgi:N,N'-diacetylchitobiose phosphorylase
VSNPEGVEKGVRSVSLDGRVVAGAIAVQLAGSEHTVDVLMGAVS